MTLNNLDLVISDLQKEKKKCLKFFFVSIDPKRDSTEVIKNYLGSFDNKIFGITGDPKKFSYFHNPGVCYQKKYLQRMEII